MRNAITAENEKLGDPTWRLDPALLPDEGKQAQESPQFNVFSAYPASFSTVPGTPLTITLNISDDDTAGVRMDVYRLGWYQGAGARHMWSTTLCGLERQSYDPTSPLPDGAAPWRDNGMDLFVWNKNVCTIPVGADWLDGIYWVKLTALTDDGTARRQNFTTFCVRNDTRTAALLYQQPVFTYHAYNMYPYNFWGKSLYAGNGCYTQCAPIATTSAVSVIPGTVVVTPASMQNIKVGVWLTIDTNTAKQENVLVIATTSATFTTVFTQAHDAGFVITGAGAVVSTKSSQAVSAGIDQRVTPALMQSAIMPGASIQIDAGLPTQETVRVTETTETDFTASFTRDHAEGFSITIGLQASPDEYMVGLFARSLKVSFDRPYQTYYPDYPVWNNSAGSFLQFSWEPHFIAWAEYMGYDITYTTDYDVHHAVATKSGRSLTSVRGLLCVGHDEYWTQEMVDGWRVAIDQGVHAAFFGSNIMYWRVRLEPSPATGIADRVMVCYKYQPDPADLRRPTIAFRDLGEPEENIIGVQYISNGSACYGPDLLPITPHTSSYASERPNARESAANRLSFYYGNPQMGVMTPIPLTVDARNATRCDDAQIQPYQDFIITNADHWVWRDTGAANGTCIPGIVGYEIDAWMDGANAHKPGRSTYTTLGSSPYRISSDITLTAESSIYQNPSGAWVFAAGTLGWAYGLWNFAQGPHRANDIICRATRNILDRFIAS